MGSVPVCQVDDPSTGLVNESASFTPETLVWFGSYKLSPRQEL